MLLQHMLRTSILLALFAVIGTGLVAYTYDSTKAKIAYNEKQFLLKKLHVIITPDEHDNELFQDVIAVTSENLLGTKKSVSAYRARKNGAPVGVIIAPIVPDGYNGEIKLLVGIYYDGSLAGVRVISHRETPGLGDRIEEKRSDWILTFRSRSLENPGTKDWRVKRDGGAFDQFTGATITPRAIVKAVKNCLLYYADNKQQLFSPLIVPEDSTGSKTLVPHDDKDT